MDSKPQLYVFLTILSLRVVSACFDDERRELAFPPYFFFANKRLVSHNITTVKVRDMDACRLRCFHEPNCVSINFNYTASAKGTYRCDLNNATHRGHDEAFVDTDGYLYRGADSACDRAHCDNGGTCQSGFTDKGYRCLCPPGFMSAHCKQDVNECASGTHNCSHFAVCNNTQGSFNCTCKQGYTGNGYNCTVYKSCSELYKAGKRTSGVYTINPDNGGAFDVYCDQTTAGGGWTVFQKRLDGSVNFYRGWDDYKRGFGNLNGELWLGLDKIHRLTKEKSKLRVDLEDFSGNTAYAEYSSFAVGDERSKYKLSIDSYSGTAGDSLSYHRGMAFSTKDRDNDRDGGYCATKYKGAWWYKDCHHSNLNGRYLKGQQSLFGDGVNWMSWKGFFYSVKRAEMKIKPVNA